MEMCRRSPVVAYRATGRARDGDVPTFSRGYARYRYGGLLNWEDAVTPVNARYRPHARDGDVPTFRRRPTMGRATGP